MVAWQIGQWVTWTANGHYRKEGNEEEGERETDRQTDRQTDMDRDTKTSKQTMKFHFSSLFSQLYNISSLFPLNLFRLPRVEELLVSQRSSISSAQLCLRTFSCSWVTSNSDVGGRICTSSAIIPFVLQNIPEALKKI